MRRSPLSRSLAAVTVAALAGGVLAGCTGFSLGGGCEVAPGDASRTVSATGDLGSTPVVEFPTPLIPRGAEASTLLDGDGDDIEDGSFVFGNVVYFDAQSGQVLGETPSFVRTGEAGLAIGEALACVTRGSRVAVVGPAELLSGNPELLAAVGADTSLLAVIDVEQVYLGQATGVNQLPKDGMPTVVTAVDGTPGISSTYLPAAEEARTATIKAGSGAVVEEGDRLVFHARSWNWSAGASTTVSLGQVDSWGRGSPFLLEPTVDSMGDETLVDALIGSKVGSQILVVIPDADGTGTATVYVFDILGIDNE